jgi:co-chaperonin GroES (HSP10)
MENIVIPMNFNAEKKRPTYDQVVDLECPYEALGDRVIVIHIENEESKKKKSAIYIPEHIKKSMEATENFIIPGIVKAVGKGTSSNNSSFDVAPTLEVNDIVYTYPGGFEAKLTKGDTEYLIFSRRDILLKVK